MTIYYSAGGWRISDEPAEGAVEVSPELYSSLMGKSCEPGPGGQPRATTAQRRADLLDAITTKRWEIETGGITLPGGIAVKTDTSDQLRIGSTIEGMKANGYTTVPFKAASGWIDLSLDQIEALRSAVAEHVRQCFIAERAHHFAIAALVDADLDSYDINTGWPVATLNLLEI